MATNWKSLLLWSSIGSLAFGATLTLARRHRRPTGEPATFQRIPGTCRRIIIWTERFSIEDAGESWLAHDKYVLQATPFKVWHMLDNSHSMGKKKLEGADVYHVTQFRFIEANGRGEERIRDSFYGTARVVNAAGQSGGKNYLSRGGTLELHKCRIGGASNGIETDELHRSSGLILNYRFEYTSE